MSEIAGITEEALRSEAALRQEYHHKVDDLTDGEKDKLRDVGIRSRLQQDILDQIQSKHRFSSERSSERFQEFHALQDAVRDQILSQTPEAIASMQPEEVGSMAAFIANKLHGKPLDAVAEAAVRLYAQREHEIQDWWWKQQFNEPHGNAIHALLQASNRNEAIPLNDQQLTEVSAERIHGGIVIRVPSEVFRQLAGITAIRTKFGREKRKNEIAGYIETSDTLACTLEDAELEGIEGLPKGIKIVIAQNTSDVEAAIEHEEGEILSLALEEAIESSEVLKRYRRMFSKMDERTVAGLADLANRIGKQEVITIGQLGIDESFITEHPEEARLLKVILQKSQERFAVIATLPHDIRSELENVLIDELRGSILNPRKLLEEWGMSPVDIDVAIAEIVFNEDDLIGCPESSRAVRNVHKRASFEAKDPRNPNQSPDKYTVRLGGQTYIIEKVIKQGGFGVTYKARIDGTSDQYVVIKENIISFEEALVYSPESAKAIAEGMRDDQLRGYGEVDPGVFLNSLINYANPRSPVTPHDTPDTQFANFFNQRLRIAVSEFCAGKLTQDGLPIYDDTKADPFSNAYGFDNSGSVAWKIDGVLKSQIVDSMIQAVTYFHNLNVDWAVDDPNVPRTQRTLAIEKYRTQMNTERHNFLREHKIGEILTNSNVSYVARERGFIAGDHPVVGDGKIVRLAPWRRMLQIQDYIDGTDLWDTYQTTDDVDDPAWHRLVTKGIAQLLINPIASAHANNIVHRDINPDNIMIDKNGDFVLIDWGNGSITNLPQWVNNAMVGMPGFAAPEQYKGFPSTPATDQYGAARVLYTLLTDSNAENAAGMMQAMQNRVDPELQTIILRATQTDPALRYSSAQEMGLEIDKVLSRQGITLGATPPTRVINVPRPPTQRLPHPVRFNFDVPSLNKDFRQPVTSDTMPRAITNQMGSFLKEAEAAVSPEEITSILSNQAEFIHQRWQSIGVAENIPATLVTSMGEVLSVANAHNLGITPEMIQQYTDIVGKNVYGRNAEAIHATIMQYFDTMKKMARTNHASIPVLMQSFESMLSQNDTVWSEQFRGAMKTEVSKTIASILRESKKSPMVPMRLEWLGILEEGIKVRDFEHASTSNRLPDDVTLLLKELGDMSLDPSLSPVQKQAIKQRTESIMRGVRSWRSSDLYGLVYSRAERIYNSM